MRASVRFASRFPVRSCLRRISTPVSRDTRPAVDESNPKFLWQSCLVIERLPSAPLLQLFRVSCGKNPSLGCAQSTVESSSACPRLLQLLTSLRLFGNRVRRTLVCRSSLRLLALYDKLKFVGHFVGLCVGLTSLRRELRREC